MLLTDANVQVDVPDVKGRVAILNVHARNKKLDDEVDLEQIALRTPGFSGALSCCFSASIDHSSSRQANAEDETE